MLADLMPPNQESLNCGAVHEEELSDFLALMTETFSMEPVATSQIFYRDPYFDLQNKRVLRVEGKIVSCLTLVERAAKREGMTFPVFGICGMSTHTKVRRNGYARRLLTDTLSLLRERNIPFVLLNPVSSDYYRRLGWEYVTSTQRLTTPPSTFPESPEVAGVRSLSRRDGYALSLIYDRLSRNETFLLTRDTKRWKFLLEFLRFGVIYAPKNGVPEGYLLYDLFEETIAGEQKSVLRVQEMLFETSRARRASLTFLSRQPVDLIQVEGTFERHIQNELFTLSANLTDAATLSETETLPTVMARIADFGKALAVSDLPSLPLSKLEEKSVRCVMLDPLHPEGKQEVVISGEGIGKKDQLTGGISSACVLTADVSVWTRLLLGAISGEDCLAQGILLSSDEVTSAVAEELFPLKHPYISPIDYF